MFVTQPKKKYKKRTEGKEKKENVTVTYKKVTIVGKKIR